MKLRDYLSEELVITDQYDRVVGIKKLKFTKNNIEKIGYQYDAEIQKIDADIKFATLKDPQGRLLFVSQKTKRELKRMK